jgi:5-methyltetrahydrofolate--homocysteine methyltransferase
MKLAAGIIREHGLECFMGLPDLNGPTEVLSGLRNPEKMCMDLIMAPEKVLTAARQVQDAWYTAWEECSAIASPFGTCSSFMGIWSDIPATDLQSDFSSLISPEMFNEFIYPFVREQAERIPRTVFHLDGPDMIRHLDTLLGDENINAIQWVYGAGGGKATDWIDLMRRIQDGGKALFVYCEEDEVLPLADALDARGLMMVVRNGSSEKSARELLSRLGRD